VTATAAPSGPARALKLEGQVVIVTGGAAGLGRVYARRLLAEGARVMLADIADTADAVRALAPHGEVAGVHTDVAVAESTRALADETVRRFGRIDVLVNNAAVFAVLKPQAFDCIPEAEWDRVMAVNVKGIWNCVKAVLPTMRAQGSGRIVNVASAIAPKGTPRLLHYVTSKGAVITMTRALARELGEFGIGVNALAPGLTLSDTVLSNPDISAFQAEAVLQSRSFKRAESPADLEGALVFLASADSAFVTGQTLVVDGGSIFV
jgi:NAD(P)-dependent dehydrogenase (short-subunit alcohol dehydrogenase family)